MSAVVQWSVEQFWGELQNLKAQLDRTDAALKADAKQLGTLYATLRARYDPMRDILVAPQIHRNTVLRTSYLNPVRAKYAQAVNAAAGVLRGAGYTVPNLGEVGVLPAVPVVAIAAVVVALSAVAIAWRLTEAQVNRTATIRAIFSDPHTTPEQKAALAKSLQGSFDASTRNTPPPLGFDLGMLVPLAAIVAAIVLVPPILKMLPARSERATA